MNTNIMESVYGSRLITAERVIDYTNCRLENWYVTVKEDYGVVGSGYTSLDPETNEMIIFYEEDGVKAQFRLKYWNECLDFLFEVWAREADVERDRIN